MDLKAFKESYSNMNYDGKKQLSIPIKNTNSTIIITENSDLESATDFIIRCLQAEDLNVLRSILVQVSVTKAFLQSLTQKMDAMKEKPNPKEDKNKLKAKMMEFTMKGFTVMWNSSGPAIVGCPPALIGSDDLPIISLEFFRTTKEGITFAKSAKSVNLWCENISIAFEWINSLPNSRQIWLNSSHGVIHKDVPFYNGNIVCENPDVLAKATAGDTGTISSVSDNTHFVTTFRDKSFQTVVIPFGETFAN